MMFGPRFLIECLTTAGAPRRRHRSLLYDCSTSRTAGGDPVEETAVRGSVCDRHRCPDGGHAKGSADALYEDRKNFVSG